MGNELNLPIQDVPSGELLSGDIKTLEVDDDVDPTEVADLVQDVERHENNPEPEEFQRWESRRRFLNWRELRARARHL